RVEQQQLLVPAAGRPDGQPAHAALQLDVVGQRETQLLGVELLGRVTVEYPDRHDGDSGDHEPSRSWVMSQLLPSGSSTPNHRPHGASSTWLFGCTPRAVSSA